MSFYSHTHLPTHWAVSFCLLLENGTSICQAPKLQSSVLSWCPSSLLILCIQSSRPGHRLTPVLSGTLPSSSLSLHWLISPLGLGSPPPVWALPPPPTAVAVTRPSFSNTAPAHHRTPQRSRSSTVRMEHVAGSALPASSPHSLSLCIPVILSCLQGPPGCHPPKPSPLLGPSGHGCLLLLGDSALLQVSAGVPHPGGLPQHSAWLCCPLAGLPQPSVLPPPWPPSHVLS